MTATYDTDLGQFLRTFHIRYVHKDCVFELPIVAPTWADAEAMLRDIKLNGHVHNVLEEVVG